MKTITTIFGVLGIIALIAFLCSIATAMTTMGYSLFTNASLREYDNIINKALGLSAILILPTWILLSIASFLNEE